MKTYIVDSFTREAFSGNPAGVCFPDRQISDAEMLHVANEFGLSETAFVYPCEKDGAYNIRYFSPKKEIPLCGHATLASAKVIFNNTGFSQIHFITAENLDLFIRRENEEIIMEFPIYETIAVTVPESAISALGITALVNSRYSEKNKIILIEIADADLLAQLNPDFNTLVNSCKGINGILVTAVAKDSLYDYHYRYFWPWAGTNEDPVTGGVQTFLAKYWQDKLGKSTMRAFQSSARTGSMGIELKDNKVLVKGEAVIVLAGRLLVFGCE